MSRAYAYIAPDAENCSFDIVAEQYADGQHSALDATLTEAGRALRSTSHKSSKPCQVAQHPQPRQYSTLDATLAGVITPLQPQMEVKPSAGTPRTGQEGLETGHPTDNSPAAENAEQGAEGGDGDISKGMLGDAQRDRDETLSENARLHVG